MLGRKRSGPSVQVGASYKVKKDAGEEERERERGGDRKRGIRG